MPGKVRAKLSRRYLQRLPTYEGLLRKRRMYSRLELAVLLSSVVWITFLVLNGPDTSNGLAVLAWGTVIGLSSAVAAVIYNAIELRKADIERIMLYRELWYIKHRLGLPLDPEELEDIEAYREWLAKRWGVGDGSH